MFSTESSNDKLKLDKFVNLHYHCYFVNESQTVKKEHGSVLIDVSVLFHYATISIKNRTANQLILYNTIMSDVKIENKLFD